MKLLVYGIRKSVSLSHRGIFSLFQDKKSKFGNFGFVSLGNVSAERPVPDEIIKPNYYFDATKTSNTIGPIEIKNAEQIKRMEESCKLAANVLSSCKNLIREGITTDEIDAYVHDRIIAERAYPSPLRYSGFPKSVCTSVNNVACHGIPDDRKLMDGDIINVDITVYYRGFHGDCSKTYLVGNVDKTGRKLVQWTEECLLRSIDLCEPGRPFNAIGKFIDEFAKERDLTSIPAFIGHGIGSYFHGPPEIYHFDNNLAGEMKPGMTFTIEPILSLGGPEIEVQEDGWTAMTVDNARTAQFEHTVLITDDGVKILTVPD